MIIGVGTTIPFDLSPLGLLLLYQKTTSISGRGASK
nr:MAG TPA: hypothetical protein [Caudoviricetes sp.]DAT37975.1 MAG TPA: hypothetical protein [Caudoviricetes sp.]